MQLLAYWLVGGSFNGRCAPVDVPPAVDRELGGLKAWCSTYREDSQATDESLPPGCKYPQEPTTQLGQETIGGNIRPTR
jgi:hypothetical protein